MKNKTYNLGPSLDPFKHDLEQYGVLQARRTYSRCINTTKSILLVKEVVFSNVSKSSD